MFVRLRKENGVVAMDRVIYGKEMHVFLNGKSKFKKLSRNLKKLREGQLWRYLRVY